MAIGLLLDLSVSSDRRESVLDLTLPADDLGLSAASMRGVDRRWLAIAEAPDFDGVDRWAVAVPDEPERVGAALALSFCTAAVLAFGAEIPKPLKPKLICRDILKGRIAIDDFGGVVGGAFIVFLEASVLTDATDAASSCLDVGTGAALFVFDGSSAFLGTSSRDGRSLVSPLTASCFGEDFSFFPLDGSLDSILTASFLGITAVSRSKASRLAKKSFSSFVLLLSITLLLGPYLGSPTLENGFVGLLTNELFSEPFVLPNRLIFSGNNGTDISVLSTWPSISTSYILHRTWNDFRGFTMPFRFLWSLAIMAPALRERSSCDAPVQKETSSQCGMA